MKITPYSPTQVLGAQPTEYEVTWTMQGVSNSNNTLDSRWITERSLRHLSNTATGDIREQTQSLLFVGFNITDATNIVGIGLDVAGNRNGRIVDQIVQLTYQGEPLGENNFSYITDVEGHLPITNLSTYGGPTDLWGAQLTPEIVQDPSFGVILKFQSHPYYPHRDRMILDRVTLTLYQE